MSAGWTLVLLAAGIVIAVLAASWRHRVDTAELGTVSAGWLAEHRATDAHYPER
jgi:hypothetical protein